MQFFLLLSASTECNISVKTLHSPARLQLPFPPSCVNIPQAIKQCSVLRGIVARMNHYGVILGELFSPFQIVDVVGVSRKKKDEKKIKTKKHLHKLLCASVYANAKFLYCQHLQKLL